MVDPVRSRSASGREKFDAAWFAGLVLTVISIVWVVAAVVSLTDDVRGNLSALTDHEGDARRGLFLYSLIVGIQLGMVVVSGAIVRSHVWARWTGLVMAVVFGVLTMVLLVGEAEPVEPLVLNLAALMLAAALLTASLLAARRT